MAGSSSFDPNTGRQLLWSRYRRGTGTGGWCPHVKGGLAGRLANDGELQIGCAYSSDGVGSVKPHRTPLHSFRAKLAPGNVIRFKPHVLKALGWRVGDVLVWVIKGKGLATLFKKPSEAEWRVERLKRRLGDQYHPLRDRFAETYLGWLRQGKVRYRK